MKWILIIVMYTSNGLSTSSTEFNTLETCTFAMDDLKALGDRIRPTIFAGCYKK